jgi:hypothetical protein
MQEKDLRLVPDEGEGKDITVYLGLAAAAFLLLTLYPNREVPMEDVSLLPSSARAAAGLPETRRKERGFPPRASSPVPQAADTGESSSVCSGDATRNTAAS